MKLFKEENGEVQGENHGRAPYLEDRKKEGTNMCNRKTRSEIWEENQVVPCFEKQERYFRATRGVKYSRKNEEV